MAYPLIVAANGEMMARVNHDRSWSVQWDRVIKAAYAPPHLRQMAVRSYARLLLAAKDNFFVTPWSVSDEWYDEWKHYEAVIDYIDINPPADSWLSTISYNNKIIARVNFDGTWSVLWNEVLEVARWTIPTHLAAALIGICQILQAGKDRFLTTPWDVPEDLE